MLTQSDQSNLRHDLWSLWPLWPGRAASTTIGMLALLISFALVSGCYPDWPEHSGTAQVEGEVFLDGFPINKANIVFLPTTLKNQSGKLMPLAFGQCDARGKFKMEYRDGSPNILAGKYHVVITLVDIESALSNGDPFAPNQISESSSNSLQNLLAAAKSGPVSRAQLAEQVDRHQVVPAIYNRLTSLKYEVVASPGIVRTKFDLPSVDPLLNR